MKRVLAALVLAVLALGVQAPGSAAATRGLELGLADTSFNSADAALRDEWMVRARGARADLVLLGVPWSSIAPKVPPAGFDSADPADPAYDWETLDGAVRAAVAQGLEPVLDINFAPRWAEGPNRPSTAVAPAGTWLPQPEELGRFSRALGARYAGGFADPGSSIAGPLPRVRYFQVWAEQNLSIHLTPLWQGGKLVAPAHYRAMLNAAYTGFHAANAGARVIVGGLAPYGDPEVGADRIPPVWFWRSFLCLRGAELRPLACPEPARFDLAAHNPINVWGPRRGAVSRLDVSTPDIGRLKAILRRATATGRVLPAGPKPFWAMEIWWDSRPPDPGGVPLRRQARFLGEALFELWRQGVGAVVWWFLRDHPGGAAGLDATQQSGLFFLDGRPKPAHRAFRFPFVARRDRGRLLLWGKAPSPGRLVAERRTRGGWVPLARLRAGPRRVFLTRLDASRKSLLVRVKQGSEVSIPARVAAGKGGP